MHATAIKCEYLIRFMLFDFNNFTSVSIRSGKDTHLYRNRISLLMRNIRRNIGWKTYIYLTTDLIEELHREERI